eukprot:6177025-Pleurochrysis_carterae.AAC.1
MSTLYWTFIVRKARCRGDFAPNRKRLRGTHRTAMYRKSRTAAETMRNQRVDMWNRTELIDRLYFGTRDKPTAPKSMVGGGSRSTDPLFAMNFKDP